METQSPGDALGASTRSAILSIAVNAGLAAIKFTAGVLGNSYALIADAMESSLDIVSSLVALGGIRIASIPADENHPYGHGKAEPLAALLISLFLAGAAAGLAAGSVHKILHPEEPPAWYTLPVLVVVVVVKEAMFRYVSKAGSSMGSTVLQADAAHHRSDALTSGAALAGISIALIGGPGYECADAWAALAACGLIAFNGIRMIRPALAEVMDAVPGTDIEARVRSIALAVKDVQSLDKCRVRRYGLKWVVDLHVRVDGALDVARGHQIAHEVKDALIRSGLNITEVLVHIEPA